MRAAGAVYMYEHMYACVYVYVWICINDCSKWSNSTALTAATRMCAAVR